MTVLSLNAQRPNRGGVASSTVTSSSSSSSSSSIDRRTPPLLLLSRPRLCFTSTTSSASSPPSLDRQGRLTTARVSLWDSIFGGGEKGGGAASAAAAAEEELVLLDPDSLPACLPEPVLSRTFLSGRPLAVAYTASVDGWSALVFHEKCDFKGPSLVVAETTDGAVFGGYFSDCWTSSDDYKSSFKPFLFAFSDDDDGGDGGGDGERKLPLGKREVFVCEKVGGPEAALFDYARGGPQFGSDGLLIGPPLSPVMGGFAGPDSPTQGAGDLRSAKSRLGLSFAELPKRKNGARRSLFGGGKGNGGGSDDGRDEATLREVTVYFAPELAKLYR